MDPSFLNANIVTAFGSNSIGTKVIDPHKFWRIVGAKVLAHDTSKDRAPGQHFIIAPELHETLRGGVGQRTLNIDDYLPRLYRGKVSLFLRREFAEKLNEKSFIALIIYTRDAYLRDPDTLGDPAERARVLASDATHVLVAIIAGSNYMSPSAAIHNIAGGNNEWLAMTAEELRAKAKWVEEVDTTLCTVAD